ncbi:MAG: response regulator [bacterium]|nr:response regulator [bacterium]
MADKKILSIEDDTFLLALLSGKLTESGYKVLTATTGADGLAKAKMEHPDIILLDVMLPDIGGFEVLEQLKTDAGTQAIPVILLSNLGGRDEIDQGKALGATSYLIKANIVPDELAQMIETEVANAPQQTVAGQQQTA